MKSDDHNSRPKECSTAYLEALEARGAIDEMPDFKAELSMRRSRPSSRSIRLARLARYLEDKLEKAKHHQAYSGDVRKMTGKGK